MERTIKEIYELIGQKVENAETDLERQHQIMKMLYSGDPQEWNVFIDGEGYELNEKINRLSGQIDAYIDVLYLIESSGVLK